MTYLRSLPKGYSLPRKQGKRKNKLHPMFVVLTLMVILAEIIAYMK